MDLIADRYDIDLSEPTVLMHESDCIVIGVGDGDRVRISGNRTYVAIVTVSDTLVDAGHILMTDKLLHVCSIEPGSIVGVVSSPVPDSVRTIRAKMDGQSLSAEQLDELVSDVIGGRLSRLEVSAWLTALYIKGMNVHEIASYARAMASSGTRLDFGSRRVFDFHSFGGVPGNKITPVVVSIVASAGLFIPKLSSRAISSPSGTADFVEMFCHVDLCTEDVQRITEDVGGVFSWTGATDIAPAGDRFITVQRPLGIDPRPQMLASIISKKLAAGATDLVMDIPMGDGTKVLTVDEANSYARDLMDLGEELGINIECAVTYADQPLGHAVGPALEARECIQVLENEPGHSDVVDKACICAGMILEMGGIPNGVSEAHRILSSGEALEKFRQIVSEQGGDPCVSSHDISPGRYSREIVTPRSGFVRSISNRGIVAVAKAAGAPSDHGAGIIIHKKRGSKVSEGDVLMTVYAESIGKLDHAVSEAMSREPIDVDGMLLERVR